MIIERRGEKCWFYILVRKTAERCHRLYEAFVDVSCQRIPQHHTTECTLNELDGGGPRANNKGLQASAKPFEPSYCLIG